MHTENTCLITASAPGSCCLPALTFSSSFLCFCSPRVGFLALLPRCHCLWERIENGDKKICWSRQGEGEERSLCELWFTCVVGRSEYVYCRPTQHSFTFHHFHALSYVPWCPLSLHYASTSETSWHFLNFVHTDLLLWLRHKGQSCLVKERWLIIGFGKTTFKLLGEHETWNLMLVSLWC